MLHATGFRQRGCRHSTAVLVNGLRHLVLLQHVLLVRGRTEHEAEHGDEHHIDAEEDPERGGSIVGLHDRVDAEREEDAREHVHADEAERHEQQVERRVAAAEHLVRRRLLLLVRLDARDAHVVGGDGVLCGGRHACSRVLLLCACVAGVWWWLCRWQVALWLMRASARSFAQRRARVCFK